MNSIEDHVLLFALIDQVTRARKARGGNSTERDVITVITAPLWSRYLNLTNDDPGSEITKLEPTCWEGIKNSLSVFGTETVVIDSPLLFSFSKPISL